MPKSQQSHENRRGKGRLSRIHRCVPGGIRTPDTLFRRQALYLCAKKNALQHLEGGVI